MDLGLRDRRALVLGSTRGIGRGVAAALAAEGAIVAVCGRSRPTAADVAGELAARFGSRAEAFDVDLLDASSVERLCADVDAAFGGIDMLFCNGGGPPPGMLAEISADTWRAQLQSMFLSQLRIVDAFLPGMRERKWGRILVTSSSGAVQPIPALGISNTVRAGLIGWAKTLSNEVGVDGVTVNTLLPGRIKTERVDEIDHAAAARQGRSYEEIVEAAMATIPLRRYGTVEEYAAVAAFLLSEAASYVTGCVVRADGGFIRAT